jgi:hypothetical protein
LFSSTSCQKVPGTTSTPAGGCPEISNTYASGFWFVNQLGVVAGEGFWQLYRQNVIATTTPSLVTPTGQGGRQIQSGEIALHR